MESTHGILLLVYMENTGEARPYLYYADDSAIWPIHCKSFKSLCVHVRVRTVRGRARDMLLYCVLKALGGGTSRIESRNRKRDVPLPSEKFAITTIRDSVEGDWREWLCTKKKKKITYIIVVYNKI